MPTAPKFHPTGIIHTRVGHDERGNGGGILLATFKNLQHGMAHDNERLPVNLVLMVVSRDEPDPEPISIGETHFRARSPWFMLRVAESLTDYLTLPTTSPMEYVRVASEMYVLACDAVKSAVPPPLEAFVDLAELRAELEADAEARGWVIPKRN